VAGRIRQWGYTTMRSISETCSRRKTPTGCHTVKDIQTVQPFPSNGLLHKNLGPPLAVLKSQILTVQDRTYSYVVRSIKHDFETNTFEQHGSGPNFQGGVLTLCTCKHQMRSSQAANDWKGVWVAGFTSRTIHEGKHWLFYLAKIKFAYESHADLWSESRYSRCEGGARSLPR
jgi:hypothetical protein